MEGLLVNRPKCTAAPDTIWGEWPSDEQTSYAYGQRKEREQPLGGHKDRRILLDLSYPGVSNRFVRLRLGRLIVALVIGATLFEHGLGESGPHNSGQRENRYVLDAGSNLLPVAEHGNEGTAGTHRIRLSAQRRQEWETRRNGCYRRRPAFA